MTTSEHDLLEAIRYNTCAVREPIVALAINPELWPELRRQLIRHYHMQHPPEELPNNFVLFGYPVVFIPGAESPCEILVKATI